MQLNLKYEILKEHLKSNIVKVIQPLNNIPIFYQCLG